MADADNTTDAKSPLERALQSLWLEAVQRLKGFETNGLLGWKFTGKCDALPLSRMLVTGAPVPKQIARALGVMLNPDSHTRGPRLQLVAPPSKRTFAAYMDILIRKREARGEYQQLIKEGGNHKNVVHDLTKKFGVKTTWITDAVALNDEKFIDAIVNGTTRPQRRR